MDAIGSAGEAFALTEVFVSVWGSRRKPVLCQHPAWPLHSSTLHDAPSVELSEPVSPSIGSSRVGMLIRAWQG